MLGELLRTPAFLVGAGVLLFVTLVLTAVGYLMVRAGLSIRPVFWFAGFFLIIALPQLVYHVHAGVRAQRAGAALGTARTVVTSNDAGAGAPFESLFGPDLASAMVTDLRVAGSMFGSAESARFAVFPSGETVLMARFADRSAALDAAAAWLRASGLDNMVVGDPERGWSATRSPGDRVYLLASGALMGVWTAADDATIHARMAGGGVAVPANAPLAGAAASHAGDGRGAMRSGEPNSSAESNPSPAGIPMSLQIGALALLVFITIAYFFKGASWAAATPRVNVMPVSATELRSRMVAINDFDVPFSVTIPENSDEIHVTWRYADARWADVARLHGMRHTHRVVLRLDESAHIARVGDYTAGYDLSLGQVGIRGRWHASMGITFFHYQEERVFGLQFSENGLPKPDLSYTYRFNLQEMKAPLIAAVTHAGWDWRPVVWPTAPVWLRWLTE